MKGAIRLNALLVSGGYVNKASGSMFMVRSVVLQGDIGCRGILKNIAGGLENLKQRVFCENGPAIGNSPLSTPFKMPELKSFIIWNFLIFNGLCRRLKMYKENIMFVKRLVSIGLLISSVSACSGNTKPPSQIIYRYDDNRYLELIGYDCEGALWYHDNKINIHKELVDGVYSTYQIFTGAYIHPSDKYILVPRWEPGAYKISKDYGETWQPATYMAPYPSLEMDEDGNGIDRPLGKNIKRVVVVNNQAFITTNIGHLYMSSYPFEDPLLEPGGPGVDYTYYDEDYYLNKPGKHKSNGEYVKGHIDPDFPGSAWGTVIFMKEALTNLVDGNKANYQNLPDKEPEVTGYKGWDHMRCNMDAGK